MHRVTASIAASLTLVTALVVPPVPCVAAGWDPVVLAVDLNRIAPREPEAPRSAEVHVADLRSEAARAPERTTVGGLSMGTIHLVPPAPDIVRAIVEARADEVLARRQTAGPETVDCGIFVFDIVTPATLLYWDVRARIEVGLRVQGQERTIAAEATERTYLWPSETVLGRVLQTALDGLGAEAGRALETLLPASR